MRAESGASSRPLGRTGEDSDVRSTKSEPAPFLPNLQIARFLAAFIVMIEHLQWETRDLGILDSGFLVDFKPIYYPVGIDIFFVISGFIMFYLSHDKFNQPRYWRKFIKRRVLRIAPLYWAFLLLTLVAILVFGGRMNHTNLDWAHIATSFAFIPWPRLDGDIRPLLSAGWTLNYEMFFYGCFAIALTMKRSRGMIFIAGLFLTLAALHAFIPERWFVLVFLTRQIILEFLIGIALAALYLRGARIPVWLGFGLVALGFTLLLVVESYGLRRVLGHVCALGVPAALIVAGMVFAPEPRQQGPGYRFARLGGDASYSLYLSHAFTINLVALIWTKLRLGSPHLFFFTTLVTCVLVSVLIYQQFEKRLTSFFRRVTSREGWFVVR